MNKGQPVNAEMARARAQNIRDLARRTFAEMALAAATSRWLHPEGISAEEYAQRLPISDFDLGFFVGIIERLSADRPLLQKLVDGTLREEDLWS